MGNINADIQGFNRNILGCKGRWFDRSERHQYDLIETYWDVKVMYSVTSFLDIGFNRNILGCKVQRQNL